MDFNGLRKLTKLKTKNYKNIVHVILVCFSICGCDRPESSEEFISDVPVALSLSGGVDSNLIRKVLSEHKNFKSHSIVFEEEALITFEFVCI